MRLPDRWYSVWHHIHFNVVGQTMHMPTKSLALHYAVMHYALYYYFPLYLCNFHDASQCISQLEGAETQQYIECCDIIVGI